MRIFINRAAWIFSIATVLCWSSDVWARYSRSSEINLGDHQGSLKGDRSFVFFPFLLTGEETPQQVFNFVHQELKRVGTVIEHQMDTGKGIDLGCFSNPRLVFSLDQLVDTKNRLLPVIKATLLVESRVEIQRTHEVTSLSTSSWTEYLEKNKNVEKVVKNTFPILLEKFMAAYQEANGKDLKPTFYILKD